MVEKDWKTTLHLRMLLFLHLKCNLMKPEIYVWRRNGHGCKTYSWYCSASVTDLLCLEFSSLSAWHGSLQHSSFAVVSTTTLFTELINKLLLPLYGYLNLKTNDNSGWRMKYLQKLIVYLGIYFRIAIYSTGIGTVNFLHFYQVTHSIRIKIGTVPV